MASSNAPFSNDKIQAQDVGGGPVEIGLKDVLKINEGAYGTIFRAVLTNTNEIVAVKKIQQDKKSKNAELESLLKIDQINVVLLKYYFFTEETKICYLHFVQEFVADSLDRFVQRTKDSGSKTIPLIYTKVFMHQLLRALGYIHSMKICHADLKPENLLIDPETATLKVCDFGSSVQLVPGQSVVAVVSQFYRAPELCLGSRQFDCSIDLWAVGCILGELLCGAVVFPGDSNDLQFRKIMSILGTPTPEDVKIMNPGLAGMKFTQIIARPWTEVLKIDISAEATDLLNHLLKYCNRISPVDACCHFFFSEVRQSAVRLPSGRDVPPLANFSEKEMQQIPEWNRVLALFNEKSTPSITLDTVEDERN